MMQQQQAPGSSGGAPSHFPLLELPDAALAAVLGALAEADCHTERPWERPPPPRSVLSAGRACRRLHAAATAALDSISVNSASQQRVDSLQLYLGRHGQHVTSLEVRSVSGSPVRLLSLPASCSSLRALNLQWIEVQLGAGSGGVGVLATASALTSLRLLDGCRMDTADSVAAAVARLTGLQRLQLWSYVNSVGVLPGSMLAPLTGLTALRLGRCLDDSTLEHLSSLSSLRDLHLHHGYFASPLKTVQHLSQLTALELWNVWGSALSLPGLSRLSGLQQLEVDDSVGGLDPHSLAACSQLRHLSISGAPVDGGADGVAALLGHLRACTQLTHLRLISTLCEHAPSPSAYAGLTASSSLEVVRVDWDCEGYEDTQVCLPLSAWQPMFGGSGKSLPRLRELWLEIDRSTGAGEEAAATAAGLTAADMQALVRCCPALQELRLWGDTGLAAAGLAPLTALTQLTSLRVAGSSLPAAEPGILADSLQFSCEAAGTGGSVVDQLHNHLARAGVDGSGPQQQHQEAS